MKYLLIASAFIVAFNSSIASAEASDRGYYEFLRLVTQQSTATAAMAAIKPAAPLKARASFVKPRFTYYMSPRFVRTKTPVYGERCVTKIGSCQISPQPVGSPCQCGKIKGLTLQ